MKRAYADKLNNSEWREAYHAALERAKDVDADSSAITDYAAICADIEVAAAKNDGETAPVAASKPSTVATPETKQDDVATVNRNAWASTMARHSAKREGSSQPAASPLNNETPSRPTHAGWARAVEKANASH